MIVNQTNITECKNIHVLHSNAPTEWLAIQIVFGAFYTIICIVGIVGNLIVLLCLYSRVSFMVRQTFVWNLTIADLCVLTFSLPITAVTSFTRTWPFGGITCRVVPFLQAVSIIVTSLTLILIAYDRYHSVRYPTEQWLRYPRDVLAVVIIWAIAMISAFPYIAVLKLVPFGTLCGLYCVERWDVVLSSVLDTTSIDKVQKMYGLSVFVIQFVVPLAVNTVCYSMLFRSLSQRISRRLHREVISVQTREMLRERRRKINRMILLMLVSFFVPWLPINCMNLFRDFAMHRDNNSFSILFLAAHVVAMTSCIWNPIIYTLCNTEFSAAIYNYLPRCCRQLLRRGAAENVAVAAEWEEEEKLQPTVNGTQRQEVAKDCSEACGNACGEACGDECGDACACCHESAV